LLLFTTTQKGWSWLITHAIVEVAKALGGSFKLVTLMLKTVREMIQLPRETQKDGDTQTNQRTTNEYTKYKPRLNTQKNTLGPTRLYELVLVVVQCAHGKLPMYKLHARDHFNCSPRLFS